MHDTRRCPRTIALLVAASTIALLSRALAAPAPDASEADRQAAIAAYDAGDCAKARPLLERIDAAGATDGALLYRLYYCQVEASDMHASATLVRAREALERELPAAREPSVAFYLGNALRNAGRLSEARRVAAEATSKVEAGTWPNPATGMEAFRLGKLYADQELPEPATRWYRVALERLPAEGLGASPAAAWAARFLGARELAAGNLVEGVKWYRRVRDSRDVTPEELERLAAAEVRTGQYTEAAAAWRRAVRLNPAAGDRARYCQALATQAAEVGQLPARTTDGRPFSELGQADLEQLMGEQAEVARKIHADVPVGTDLPPQRRTELHEQISRARALFLAAALEYALRGLPVRETAFSAGYAPLVFQADNWRVPPGPPQE